MYESDRCIDIRCTDKLNTGFSGEHFYQSCTKYLAMLLLNGGSKGREVKVIAMDILMYDPYARKSV